LPALSITRNAAAVLSGSSLTLQASRKIP
jgi:hypothetical protein